MRNNSIKSLHELSVQRRINSGKPNPLDKKKQGQVIKTEEDYDLYLEKLMKDPIRIAPKTKKMIKDWDEDLAGVKKWRMEEESNFKKELRKIENQNQKLKEKKKKKVELETKEFDDWCRYIGKKNSHNIQKFNTEVSRRNKKFSKELKIYENEKENPIFQANDISKKINESEQALASKRNGLGNWGSEMENFLNNFGRNLENSKVELEVKENDPYDSIDKELWMKKMVEGNNDEGKRNEIDDCLDELESEFDEIEKMMKECGMDMDDDC